MSGLRDPRPGCNTHNNLIGRFFLLNLSSGVQSLQGILALDVPANSKQRNPCQNRSSPGMRVHPPIQSHRVVPLRSERHGVGVLFVGGVHWWQLVRFDVSHLRRRVGGAGGRRKPSERGPRCRSWGQSTTTGAGSEAVAGGEDWKQRSGMRQGKRVGVGQEGKNRSSRRFRGKRHYRPQHRHHLAIPIKLMI